MQALDALNCWEEEVKYLERYLIFERMLEDKTYADKVV